MQHRPGIGKLGVLRAVVIVTSFFAATTGAPVASDAPDEGPSLQWPVDCTPGSDCWVARYVDRGNQDGSLDYRCGQRTQDKHNGTDIVLPSMADMERGVAVRAAARGRVLAVRDGMPDIVVTDERREKILKQGCGNIIILGHANGWRTRYCHLKKDSLLVKKGDRVDAGQAIALVGLSGLTEFPHLHFMVHRNDGAEILRYVDPFDGGTFEDDQCNVSPENTSAFWAMTVPYQPSAVMPPVIDTVRRTRKTMWEPQPTTLSTNSLMLIVQARGFHALEGDEWRIRLMDPNGQIRVNRTITQRISRQLIEAFAGLRIPANGFAEGRWAASVELMRGGRTIGRQTTTVLIEP